MGERRGALEKGNSLICCRVSAVRGFFISFQKLFFDAGSTDLFCVQRFLSVASVSLPEQLCTKKTRGLCNSVPKETKSNKKELVEKNASSEQVGKFLYLATWSSDGLLE